MIDLAILGLLTEQDLHGYELKKQLAELLPGRGRGVVRVAVPGAGPARGRRLREGRRATHRTRPPPR